MAAPRTASWSVDGASGSGTMTQGGGHGVAPERRELLPAEPVAYEHDRAFWARVA
jgi:hypothetical protein